MNKYHIPLCKPTVDGEELKAIEEVLQSGWYAHGPKCKEFETEFAKYIGAKRAISVNSCTAALHLAVQANNIKGEVIVPSFTFVASANAIVTAGAKPVFCEIDYETCNIDIEDAAKRITEKTEAIMPVHFAGLPADMKRVVELAREHDLKIIEDSAECIGGEHGGRKAGSFGFGCFSFYPTKNMTTGEGGMLTLQDESLHEVLNALKGHGIMSSAFERERKDEPWLRAASLAGYNFRMCDILASMGLVQLRKIDEMNRLRRNHARFLSKNLDRSNCELPKEPSGTKHVYQMYTIKLREGIDRKSFIHSLREAGIGASVHFDPPVHQQPFYNKGQCFPVTEKVAKTIVTLPIYPSLSQEELEYMAEKVNHALHACNKVR